jgi:hypothetical protein
MALSVKMSLTCSGIFLLSGMILGVVKYHKMMTSPSHQAPIYIDFAHRASLLYSFAALVMAELLRYSPYSSIAQVWMAGLPLFFFAVTVGRYVQLGLENTTDNQYRVRNFITTWGMYLLIAGQIGGFTAILWGFLQTQVFT